MRFVGTPRGVFVCDASHGWRIDKAAHDFNHPADMASDMDLFVWMPCDQCGRQAKLHMKRELKPLQ